MKPVMPYNLAIGGDYWASWGSKGWTAVRVTDVKRKFAKVVRVDPKTNESKKRDAKVLADEMVKRDPAERGADKPDDGPDVVFADVRQHRDQEQSKQLVLTKSDEKPVSPTEGMTDDEKRAYYAKRAKESVARWAKVEAHFGEEVVSQWPSDEDW